MRDLTNEIVELIRRTSSSLPKDVEDRLRASIEKEAPGSAAREYGWSSRWLATDDVATPVSSWK